MVAGSELFLCTADLKRQIRWFTGHTVWSCMCYISLAKRRVVTHLWLRKHRPRQHAAGLPDVQIVSPTPLVLSLQYALQSEAHILATDQDGSFAVSGSPAERSLAVWDLKPKKKKAQLSAAAVLSMEHPALHAAILRSQPLSGSDRPACFHVAAVGQGGAYAWECLPQGSGQVAAELRLRIHPPARSISPPPTLFACALIWKGNKPSWSWGALTHLRSYLCDHTVLQTSMPCQQGRHQSS